MRLRVYHVAILHLAAVWAGSSPALAQTERTRPLELPAELQPLDELLRTKMIVWFEERDKALEPDGSKRARWHEANDKFNPLNMHGQRLLDYARQHPGTPAAFACLSYIIDWGEGDPKELHLAAWDELLKHERDNPALAWLASRSENPFFIGVNEQALKKLLATSRNPQVQAAAAFHLARLYDQAANLRPFVDDNRRIFRDVGNLSALSLVDNIERRGLETLMAERTKYLDLVRTKYADQTPWEAKRTFGRLDYEFQDVSAAPTYGQQVAQLEYELEWLRIGCIAPVFRGTTVERVEFDLEKQRGKPVLLMFSFKGCGPCEAFYPTLRELQQKFAGDGLQVIGIMTDEKVEAVHEAIAAGDITWPCIWDGDDGPITTKFQVEGFPTIVLLDAKGRIVSRATDKVMLERALDAMKREP